MSQADPAALRPLARHDDEPVFDEPWQAQTLAIAATLVERGLFTPGQWSESLGAALEAAELRGQPDDLETYYAAALSALEQLVSAKGTIGPEALDARTEAWRRAYLNTRHGAPVELSAGLEP